MLIEVINEIDSPNTDKGNLLENLAAEFLKTQGYEVSSQVRVTASELDLLCKHKVSGKEVYVECKAHKDNLSMANRNTQYTAVKNTHLRAKKTNAN